jgi:hypothetical protein
MKAVVKVPAWKAWVAHQHPEEGEGGLGPLDPDLVKGLLGIDYQPHGGLCR